jgi:hypothetical protein
MRLLPLPVLENVNNQTGFTHFQYDKMAPGKSFHDIVLVKASFDLSPEGISKKGEPGQLVLADVHRDPANPLGSSLAAAGDLILHKPGCDLYVSGAVRFPYPDVRFPVGVSLGPTERPSVFYQCVVTGPRRWQHSWLKGWHLGEPLPTQDVPILYELSFGGRKRDTAIPVELWDEFPDNPAGSGYSFLGCSPEDTPAAPQWESVNLRSREMGWRGFVGLGPVARHWNSRAQFVGTYNKQWHAQYSADATSDGAPPILDYPPDFDPRFFQCAHPGLQSAGTPWGDERLRLMGFFQELSLVDTALPDVAVMAFWQQGQARVQRALALDTVHIDLPMHAGQSSCGKVHLVWRLSMPQSMGIKKLHLQTCSARAVRAVA